MINISKGVGQVVNLGINNALKEIIFKVLSKQYSYNDYKLEFLSDSNESISDFVIKNNGNIVEYIFATSKKRGEITFELSEKQWHGITNLFNQNKGK